MGYLSIKKHQQGLPLVGPVVQAQRTGPRQFRSVPVASQLVEPLDLVKKFIGFGEKRNRQTAIGGMRDVGVAARPPHKLPAVAGACSSSKLPSKM